MRGLFITGTDTGVGKTHVACRIIRDSLASGRVVAAYKPACSGADLDGDGNPSWSDVEALQRALNSRFSADEVCPQRYLAPLAPPIAARMERRTVDWDQLNRGLMAWQTKCDLVVIEGAGGLLCPLTDELSIADWAEKVGAPLVIVARMTLGTINHTLLTIEVAQRRGLKIAGIVLNESTPVPSDDWSASTNAAEIAARCDVPILAILKHQAAGWVSRFGESLELDWWSFSEECFE